MAKRTAAKMARDRAVKDMKAALKNMRANAQTLIGAIDEALQAEDPDEIASAAEDFDIDSIAEEAKSIPTIEYPAED
jgi:hypothetical protein